MNVINLTEAEMAAVGKALLSVFRSVENPPLEICAEDLARLAPRPRGTRLPASQLPSVEAARDRAEAEIITLAHELVQRAEENPSAAVVAQLARRIADAADELARP